MFLFVLIGVLCWQVWAVVTPQEPTPPILPPSPSSNPPELDLRPPGGRPPAPKLEDWTGIFMRNPFWYYSIPPTPEGQPPGDDENPGIRLLHIQRMPDGTARAQLFTITAKWYKEGEPFESYELISIDPDAKTCEVYSEKLGKTITLSMPKAK